MWEQIAYFAVLPVSLPFISRDNVKSMMLTSRPCDSNEYVSSPSLKPTYSLSVERINTLPQ